MEKKAEFWRFCLSLESRWFRLFASIRKRDSHTTVVITLGDIRWQSDNYEKGNSCCSRLDVSLSSGALGESLSMLEYFLALLTYMNVSREGRGRARFHARTRHARVSPKSRAVSCYIFIRLIAFSSGPSVMQYLRDFTSFLHACVYSR